MEGLYQTLPYPYLPQAPTTDYSNPTANHSGSPASTPLMMYRPTLERPVDPLENHPLLLLLVHFTGLILTIITIITTTTHHPAPPLMVAMVAPIRLSWHHHLQHDLK